MKKMVATICVVAVVGIAYHAFYNEQNCKHNKCIALTFDDGPRAKVLNKLLPILEQYHAPATFFVNGCHKCANQHGDCAKFLHKEAALGFEIENHTYCHEPLQELYAKGGADLVKKNIDHNAEVIQRFTGHKPRYFRAPHWFITPPIQAVVERDGYVVVKLDQPDINSSDYNDTKAADLVARMKKDIRIRESHQQFQDVIGFHELPVTVEALKTLLPYYVSRGYRFVRLDEMYP